jgi:hypothetical protein
MGGFRRIFLVLPGFWGFSADPLIVFSPGWFHDLKSQLGLFLHP